MSALKGEETVIRLLFADRMVLGEGKLTPEAFPTEELAAINGKSVSVDRLSLMREEWILSKLTTYENPAKGRAKWGAAYSPVNKILNIKDQNSAPVFCVQADPIEKNFPPNPWDAAHGKIISAQPTKGKGFIRGFRDQIIDAFSKDIRKSEPQ